MYERIILNLAEEGIITRNNRLNPKFKTRIRNTELENEVIELTQFLDSTENIHTRLLCIIHGITKRPKCKTCGKSLKPRKHIKLSKGIFPSYCNSACVSRSKKVREQACQTNLEKYGVENPFESESCKSKAKQTKLERYGDENYSNKSKAKQTNLERHGVENPLESEACKSKAKQTKLEKYGDENYANREQAKQTNLERHGVENPFESEECQEKIRTTMIEKHGAAHPIQSPIIKEKIRTTMVERYGVDYSLQNPSILKKVRETIEERFGVKHALQNDDLKAKAQKTLKETLGKLYDGNHPQTQNWPPEILNKLNDPEWLYDQHHNLKKTITKIAEELGVAHSTISRHFISNDIDILTRRSSQAERDIHDFISSIYHEEIISNSKQVLTPLEIDIFIPKLKLGIEYNGIFWHSEIQGKNKKYHLNKTQKAQEAQIRLIHIWENEWILKREIVKSRLRNILGKSKRIFARKTIVVPLTAKQKRMFFNENHIQGDANSSINYGLIYQNELVAAMSFGRARYRKNIQYELIRFACMINTSVTGGASKLFAHFIKNHNPTSIISYSDKRWNSGKLYENLGFLHEGSSLPNYYYFSNDENLTLLSRIKFQKHKLANLLENYQPDLTEWENMMNNGYNRIWDCGNDIFIWKSP